MKWGVYIAGPSIQGWVLMSQPGAGGRRDLMVFDSEAEAAGVALALQGDRPYHHVRHRAYAAGDEQLGELAAAEG